jgi:hypothetical protein
MRELFNFTAGTMPNLLIRMYNALVLETDPYPRMMRGMKPILLPILLTLLIASCTFRVDAAAIRPRAQPQNQALVLSSLNETVPMGNYATNLIYYLKHAGFAVTYLTDSMITIDFLVNNLNNYSLVIWRTNTFNWVHVNYWYVGEKINSATEEKYASDFASGGLNDKTGIFGVDLDFMNAHFGPNSLNQVKLMIFISSQGNSVAPVFINAGVSSVIFCNGVISLQFGLIDDLTVQIVNYLTRGEDVNSAVYDTVSPFDQGQTPNDPLDTTYAPPFWFAGDGTLTIV